MTTKTLTKWGLALLLLPFLLLSFYAWPSSDDYAVGFFIQEQQRSTVEVLRALYVSWGGRYSTHLGALLSPVVVVHLWFYRVLVWVTWLMLLLSVHWFWRGLLAKQRSNLPTYLWAGVFMILWLQVVPGIADSFFWYSGLVVYTWPLVLFFFAAGGMLRWGRSGFFLKVLVGMALFLMVGFNELAALLALILAFGAFFYRGSAKNQMRTTELWWLLGTVVVGVLILLLSPGNARRMVFFPDGQNLLKALHIASASLMKLNGVNLISIPLWLLLWVVFPHVKRDHFHASLQPFLIWNPGWVLVAGQLVLYGFLLIPAWSMGIPPPLRVYNFLTPLWLMWFLWLGISLHDYLYKRKKVVWPFISGTPLRAMILLTALSFMVNFVKIPGGDYVYGGNIPRAWSDLVFRAAPFNRAMHEREAIIYAAKSAGQPAAVVPKLVDPPRTIFFLDITSDPDHWINMLHARHYGIEKVSLKE